MLGQGYALSAQGNAVGGGLAAVVVAHQRADERGRIISGGFFGGEGAVNGAGKGNRACCGGGAFEKAATGEV